jgi:uncharacterized membrane protein (UPF0136 family)
MNTTGDLIGAIKARQAEISSSLVSGHAVNFETYQRLVGQHQGLEEALVILNDLLKENRDDE